MTDQISDQFSDQDRRAMHDWAEKVVDNSEPDENEPWITVARFILTTVEPPALTLAERVQEQFCPAPTAEQEEIILAAEKMETDLKEARVQMRALDESARRAYAGQGTNLAHAYAEHEKLLTEFHQTEAEMKRLEGERDKARSMAGEAEAAAASHFERRRELRIALASARRDVEEMKESYDKLFAEHARVVKDWEDLYIQRRRERSPETKARVITDPEELNKLPAGSVVIDQIRRAWQRNHNGWLSGSYFGWPSVEVLKSGPVTHLWEPEAKK